MRPDTPLTRELHRLVRTIALIAVGVGGGFFLLTLFLDTPTSDGFVFAIGITVALVPEGLLPTVTLSLAIGAQRMADEHALVRRLESVETLGSTTFICTDKTGTLTQNRMRIVEVWMPSVRVRRDGTGYEPTGEIEPMTDDICARLTELAVVARGCSRGRIVRNEEGGWSPTGDPMEAAIDSLTIQLTDHDRTAAVLLADPAIARFAFDPRRRRASVVTHDRVLVKGSPDAVIERCRIDADAEAAVRAAMQDLSDRGLRLLAVAARTFTDHAPTTVDEAEADLDLLGLLAFEDPPRPEAARRPRCVPARRNQGCDDHRRLRTHRSRPLPTRRACDRTTDSC